MLKFMELYFHTCNLSSVRAKQIDQCPNSMLHVIMIIRMKINNKKINSNFHIMEISFHNKRICQGCLKLMPFEMFLLIPCPISSS